MNTHVTSYTGVVGLIPAGGTATRLSPLPCSKEIYPIGFTRTGEGRPRSRVAAHCLLEGIHSAGAAQAYIVLREGKWDIPAYLGDGSQLGLSLAYLMMNAPWGVPYTVDQAYHFVRDALIIFGFPDVQFEPGDAFVHLRDHLTASNADIVLGLFPAQPPYECDRVATDDAGRVQGILVKPEETDLQYTWIMAVWTPRFTQFLHDYLATLNPGGFRDGSRGEIFMGHVMQAALEAGFRVEAEHFPDGHYIDIGTPDGLITASQITTGTLDRQ